MLEVGYLLEVVRHKWLYVRKKMIISPCKQYITLIKIFRATRGAVNQTLASKVVYIHISLNANNIVLILVSTGDRCP